jgi:hypothetical protein
MINWIEIFVELKVTCDKTFCSLLHYLCWRIAMMSNTSQVKVKEQVKQSLYRPGQAVRVSGVWVYHTFRQSAHDGGNVSPTHRPSLPPNPRKYFWYSFPLRNWVDPRGHSEIMSIKNSIDIIGKRNRDLPACSAVSPPPASPCEIYK